MRSRFITDSDSKTTAAITANDIRLLQLLNKFPYLPSTYIVRLLNLNPTTYNRRFTILRHELKLIEPPLASWAASNARYRPAVYALTARGQRELKARGLEAERAHTRTNFAHDFMSCLIVASFELGAKQHGLSFFDWQYLKRRRACEQDDHRLQVSLPGDSDARVVAPDWSPFSAPIAVVYTHNLGATPRRV